MNAEQIDDLLNVLRDEASVDAVYDAAKKLRSIGDEKAIEPLLDRLSQGSKPPWLDKMLITALYCSLPPNGPRPLRAENLLLEILDSESHDAEVRRASALALGYVGGEKVAKILIELLESDDTSLAYPCVVALGTLGDPRAVNALIEAIKSNQVLIPQAAAEALGRIGAPANKAKARLQELARKGNKTERKHALEAITRIERDLTTRGR
jgi:HEAT repeat protein